MTAATRRDGAENAAPLRILYDASVLANGASGNANRTGIFVVADELLRALLDVPGTEVGIYAAPSCVDGVNRYLAREYPGRGLLAANRSRSTLAGRLRTRLEMSGGGGAAKKLLRKALGFWNILADRRARLRRGTAGLFDVFLTPYHLPCPSVRRSGLPAGIVVYDFIATRFPEYFPVALRSRWLSETARFPRELRRGDVCFPISECTRRDLLEFCPGAEADNAAVIPLAASERFRPCGDPEAVRRTLRKYGVPEDRPYLLSLCTIEPRKNLLFALRAFAEYLARHPESGLVFVLAGGTWAKFSGAFAAALADMPELRGRVFLPGYVADEDLSPLYSGARLFLYPSRYEGFGLPPLEAMRCGCPVVASDTSSLPEVVGDAGVLIGPDDTEAAVAAVHRLCTDDSARADCVERGLARAALFSWARAAEIVVGTLKSRRSQNPSDVL